MATVHHRDEDMFKEWWPLLPKVGQSINSLWHSDAIDQHWFRWWLAAWQHQAITWTNLDLSSKVFSGFHLRAISQEELDLIGNMCSEITLFGILPHLPGANELMPEHFITIPTHALHYPRSSHKEIPYQWPSIHYNSGQQWRIAIMLHGHYASQITSNSTLCTTV